MSVMRAFCQSPVRLLAALFCLLATSVMAQPGPGGGPRFEPDPRVEARTYTFEPTGEELPYWVFVSSQADTSQPTPLVVMLHGLGVPGGFMMQNKVIELAEAAGYIVVAPQGYNTGGWYGSPVIRMGGPNAAGNANDNLAEYSEADVMNVIAMVRKEFNIDDERMFLAGHSMGGAGTLFLGQKYADMWAAIVAIAPASMMMQPDIMDSAGDALPIMIIHAASDELITLENSLKWKNHLEASGADFQYVEMAGETHGSVIFNAMATTYGFFASKTRD